MIVAGYETSYGGALNVCGPSVWGHQGGLTAGRPELDGDLVNRDGGTMFGEWMCTVSDTPGQMSTIGIMVHEIGHDIGFPDLYDTDFSSSGTRRLEPDVRRQLEPPSAPPPRAPRRPGSTRSRSPTRAG